MPVQPTYPGVYIEEVPSGVRTITGVATSIAAFIGRAPRGETRGPVTITSWADFERGFGGLAADYPMGYAVSGFFLNGGQQAIIVRLAKNAVKSSNAALKLEAASQGSWGETMTYSVDLVGITDEIAIRYNIPKADLFNLTIDENHGKGAVEKFINVSVKSDAGSRRLDRVLEAGSKLVRVQKKDDGTPDLPDAPTIPSTGVFTGGLDSAPLTTKSDFTGNKDQKTGMYALEKCDLFNLLCIPPDQREADVSSDVYQEAMQYCKDRRAMLLVDPPSAWNDAASARDGLSQLGLTGEIARNAALYFPRVIEADSQRDGQLDTFVPCGIIAGVMARTDVSRGVWKAPAGLDAAVNGVQGLSVNLNDAENGQLNPLGINCLRFFRVAGKVVWGARTLRGADQLADEYKYVPIRRLALYIEESLYRGTQWVVFEPNDEPLWSQIRLNVGAFMHNLFRQGAFQGSSSRDAYFVKCDKETTTQNDINLGVVNISVGFAPLKPAEFVIIQLQQMAGQIEV